VHSVFHQALTSTGRLSSTDPNLQNIPIRTERGSQIRKAFIAGPGHELLSADYSQIELRILAHVADDPNMIRAFADGLDIHQATASEVFSTPLAQVTSEQRRAAKAVNFGIAYGQGAFGLAENLKISRGEASEIIKNYFARFSKVQDYFTSTLEMGRQKNFVETLLGRRRYLPDLNSKNGAVRKFAERAAINAPIQGTAADIVKLAMIKVASLNDIKLVLQVHDELIFEGTREALLSRQNEVNRLMQSVVTLKVPLIVNSVVARNWFQAH
jgi:DNA polymerase-1